MKFILIGLFCLNLFVSSQSDYQASTISSILSQFENKSKKLQFKVWHLVFNKKYELGSEESKIRFKQFKETLEFIKKTNSDPENTYQVGLNQFSDLSLKEFKDIYLMKDQEIEKIKEIASNSKPFLDLNDDDDDDLTKRNLQNCPTSDFRNKISPIKNQGACGSCWAFSTMVGMENNYYEINNSVQSLSEQFLVDCDPYDHGCNGGVQNWAIKFIQTKSSGIPTTKQYPYTSGSTQTAGVCQTIKGKLFKPKGKLNTITGFFNFVKRNIAMTLIKANNRAFMSYRGGIFQDPTRGPDADHAVAVVGMGCEKGNRAYYILRNSWGVTWGEKGYMRYGYNLNSPGSTSMEQNVAFTFTR